MRDAKKKAAYNHEYYKSNRDVLLTQKRKRYHENKELDRPKRRKYRQEHKEETATYYRENKDLFVNRTLKRKYGIGLRERNRILQLQGGVCALCRKDTPTKCGWVVDHCHITNRVRGVLCQKCNTALGMLDENMETVLRIIPYLKAETRFKEEHMLKNAAGEKLSPKKYTQDFLYNALVSARAAFSDADLTDKETVKVNDQFDRLFKRASRVFGVKPAKQ